MQEVLISGISSGEPSSASYLIVQSLDEQGAPQFGDNGYTVAIWGPNGNDYRDTYVAPDDNDGFVAIYAENHGGTTGYSLLAKRCYNDGTLGGPNAPIEDVTITIDGNNTILNWSPYADSANYYIRFSDDPYSFPIEPDTTIADTLFIDIDALLEGVKFYEVRWEPLE